MPTFARSYTTIAYEKDNLNIVTGLLGIGK